MHRTLALCCLLLAACARTAPEAETVNVPETSTEAPAAPEAVTEEIVVETPPPVPGTKPAPPAIPLDKLIGLEDDMVTALIGPPTLREDRAPAVVWVYEASACSFGLLLYPDLETTHRTVLSYETEQPEGCTADMVGQ